MEYPRARRSNATQSFQSAKNGVVQVPNPYDWLDNPNGEETQAFMAAQNALLDQYLMDPALEKPKNKLIGLLQSAASYYLLRVGGRGHEHFVTFKVRKERIREFLQTSEHGHKHSISALTIFHDEADEGQVMIASGVSGSGKYWAYNTSVQGSDWGVIRVKDVETAQTLPDEVHDSKVNTTISAPIIWLGDRGFFYQYWKKQGQGRANPQIRFHVIGQPQEEDEIIYEDTAHPGYCFSSTVSDDGALVFLHVYAFRRTSQVRAARVPAADDSSRRLNLNFDIDVSDDFSYQWE
jgi:prolyl oligopeptidase